jgi:hypothetical protein
MSRRAFCEILFCGPSNDDFFLSLVEKKMQAEDQRKRQNQSQFPRPREHQRINRLQKSETKDRYAFLTSLKDAEADSFYFFPLEDQIYGGRSQVGLETNSASEIGYDKNEEEPGRLRPSALCAPSDFFNRHKENLLLQKKRPHVVAFYEIQNAFGSSRGENSFESLMKKKRGETTLYLKAMSRAPAEDLPSVCEDVADNLDSWSAFFHGETYGENLENGEISGDILGKKKSSDLLYESRCGVFGGEKSSPVYKDDAKKYYLCVKSTAGKRAEEDLKRYVESEEFTVGGYCDLEKKALVIARCNADKLAACVASVCGLRIFARHLSDPTEALKKKSQFSPSIVGEASFVQFYDTTEPYGSLFVSYDGSAFDFSKTTACSEDNYRVAVTVPSERKILFLPIHEFSENNYEDSGMVPVGPEYVKSSTDALEGLRNHMRAFHPTAMEIKEFKANRKLNEIKKVTGHFDTADEKTDEDETLVCQKTMTLYSLVSPSFFKPNQLL